MSSFWHQKSARRHPKVSIWGPFSASWAAPGDILAARWPSKTDSKRIRKNIEISMIFRVPQGSHPFAADRAPPAAKKRTISAKVAISLQRAANFQFMDFGTRLEKSISLTFSGQWLCHFSKDSGVVYPVGEHGYWETTRHPRARRHGGGYIYIYIYLLYPQLRHHELRTISLSMIG